MSVAAPDTQHLGAVTQAVISIITQQASAGKFTEQDALALLTTLMNKT